MIFEIFEKELLSGKAFGIFNQQTGKPELGFYSTRERAEEIAAIFQKKWKDNYEFTFPERLESRFTYDDYKNKVIAKKAAEAQKAADEKMLQELADNTPGVTIRNETKDAE